MTRSTDDLPSTSASGRHRIVNGDKIKQKMVEVEDEKEDEDSDMLQSFIVSLNIC